MNAIRDWFADEDHAAIATILAYGIAFGVGTVGYHYGSWTIAIIGYIGVMAVHRLMSRWRDLYQTTASQLSALEDRDDPEADVSLNLAMERLTEEELDILEENGISVQCVHDQRPLKNGCLIWAHYIKFKTRSQILIYSANMRFKQKLDDMSDEAFDDWMYRLLLHEIGHIRGYSDEQMAKEFGY